MTSFWQDVRYAFRLLARRPGFSVAAVLTVALGIAATTTIFSVADTVLLRPFPYADPDRLVVVWETQLQMGLPRMYATPPIYADWREQNQVFEEMAASVVDTFFLSHEGEPVRLRGASVTASFFPLLGVSPVQGRAFLPEDDRPGEGRVVLLSYALWQSHFGGTLEAVGRTITLNDESYLVVGVMPPDFKFPQGIALEPTDLPRPIDLWVPLAEDLGGGNRQAHFLTVIARLKPEVSLKRAEADMAAIARRLEREFPASNTGWRVSLVPLHQQLVGESRATLWVLLAAVGFLLLIACVNVANLLLARGADRQKEFAIRAALGAGQSRLARQLITESVGLALVGGLLGLLMASASMRFLLALAPRSIPRLEEAGVDIRVMLFTLAVSLLTGFLFGLAPAWQSRSPHLIQSLREGGRGSSHGVARAGLRTALVVAEVALCLVLLVGAGLLFRSFLHLTGVDPGFRAANVLTLRLTLPQSRYSERTARVVAYGEMERRLEALGGVEAAGFVFEIPLAADRGGTTFWFENEAGQDAKERRLVNNTFVTPGYFRAMGVPVTRGRNFTGQDTRDSQPVIVINQALARRYFPNRDPLGVRLFGGFGGEGPYRVIGVVGDVRHTTLGEKPTPAVYAPYAQAPRSRSLSLALRSSRDLVSLLPAVRQTIRDVEPQTAIYDTKTMEQWVSESVAQPRFSSLLLSLFAGAALTLAAVGIYGVIAYFVSQRTHEVGIRLALGAQPGDILGWVLKQGMLPVLIGMGLGCVGAYALTRFLSSLLFDLEAADPVTFVGVSALLLVVALLACMLPARRATKVDPMVALRYE